MERIRISVSDLTDFLAFTKQDGISLVNTAQVGSNYELTYNTNQIFVLTHFLYEKIQTNRIPFLIDDYKLFDKLDSWMSSQVELAVDTETDGLTRFRKCLGVSFSDGDQHFYIPLLKWDGTKLVDYWLPYIQKRVETYLRSWLRDHKKKWIGHNIVFDVITLENALGVNILDNVFSDSALLHHTCISEDPPHGLKALAAEYIDLKAGDAQEDLADNVRSKGGVWKKDRKDFYVADTPVLARYAALDPFYTMKLHKMWYPEIEKQGLQKLWFEEVLPLTKVIYQLNTTGMDIDLPYFKSLAEEVPKTIDQLEEEILSSVQDKIADYEFQYVLKKTKITERSELGKLLRDSGLTIETGKELILEWYKQKHAVKRVFNFGSKDHLGYLLYDVLGLPIMQTTKTGQASTSKAALDELLGELDGDNPTIDKIKLRSKEIKLLNTYILPILENQIDGKVYPQFNQIGTSSGRFTSGEPINFQTLPRDDHRIKKGFIAGIDKDIVDADFASLEPKCFAHMSEEPEIKRVYHEGLDLYSHVHKIVFQDDEISAREGDDNFLKLVNPAARQAAKVYCFAGDSLVQTSKGFKYIKDVGIGEEVATARGFRKVTNKLVRVAQSIEYVTKENTLVCTPDHPVWEKRKMEFDKIDSVFSNKGFLESCNYLESPTDYQHLPVRFNAAFRSGKNESASYAKLTFDETWAWLLGAFLGDGVASYKNKKSQRTLLASTIGICGLESDDVVNEFQKEVEKYGFHFFKVADHRRIESGLLVGQVADYEFGKLFQDTFNAIIVNREDRAHKNLRVMPFVFNSPTSVKLAFLAGLIDTDGYLSNNDKKRVIGFCSKSARFTSDVIQLLKSMGIKARQRLSYNKVYKRNYYMVSFTVKACEQLKDLGFVDYLRCTRKRDLAKEIQRAEINRPFSELQILERKENIIQEVYDLTIEDAHEFIVEGLRVHNCLGFAYMMSEYKYASTMGVDPEEGREVKDKYFKAFPRLKKYQDKCINEIHTKFSVANLMGRKRRAKLIPLIRGLYPKADLHDRRHISQVFDHIQDNVEYRAIAERLKDKGKSIRNSKDLYYAVKNEYNNSTNFPIQSLAASIANAAAIEFLELVKKENLDAKLSLQIHDQITAISSKKDSKRVAELLKYAMEKNKVAKMISVEMKTKPTISLTLAETK